MSWLLIIMMDYTLKMPPMYVIIKYGCKYKRNDKAFDNTDVKRTVPAVTEFSGGQ